MTTIRRENRHRDGTNNKNNTHPLDEGEAEAAGLFEEELGDGREAEAVLQEDAHLELVCVYVWVWGCGWGRGWVIDWAAFVSMCVRMYVCMDGQLLFVCPLLKHG